MLNNLEYKRRVAKSQFSKGRAKEKAANNSQNRPYHEITTDMDTVIDMDSYKSNVEKLFDLVRNFGSVESIRALWKLTFHPRRKLIKEQLTSKDSILRTMCPVLNQKEYVRVSEL